MKTNDNRPDGGFQRKLRWLNMTCADSAQIQSEGLDRHLTRLERLGLRLHLLLCAGCRRYGKQIRLLRDAFRGFPRHDDHLPEGSLSEQTRERIKEAMRQ